MLFPLFPGCRLPASEAQRTTGSIQIRRLQPGDVDAICEAVLESRAALSPWVPWCHPGYSREDTATWVAGRSGAWDRDEEKGFVIVDATARLLGCCGIHHIDAANGVAELGYWVRSRATGRGVATEATRLLTRWAFREALLHRIEMLISAENVASQRVAEKSGAVREGILRDRMLLHGRRHDAVLFSLLNTQI